MRYTVNLAKGPLHLDSHDSIRCAFRSGLIRESNVLHADSGSGSQTVQQYFKSLGHEAILAEVRNGERAAASGSNDSRPRSSFFSWVIIAILVGATVYFLLNVVGSSREDIASKALSDRITQQSDGLIKLVNFQKTNAVEHEYYGNAIYVIEYDATVEAVDDCLWSLGGGMWDGRFEATAGKARSGVEAFNPRAFGKNAVTRGQRLRVAGQIALRKTEKGWQVTR